MDQRIRKVLNYIEDNLTLKPSLNDLAQLASMSAGHFHKTFKKETGRTPFQFIEEIKMNKAFQVFISGSAQVHELALELGYGDYETFSRSFKKHHAIAPDDLKAIAQKIQTELEVGPDNLIIKTFEVETLGEVTKLMNQLSEKLSELLTQQGLNEEDIKKSKLLSVMPKSLSSGKELGSVKNKFIISENPKIWEALLNHSKNGNY